MATKAELDAEIEAVARFFSKHPDSIPTLVGRLNGSDGEQKEDKRVDISAKHRKEDEDVTAFDRLSPAERFDLYTNNHDEWERMLNAKEAAGMRKLFGTNK